MHKALIFAFTALLLRIERRVGIFLTSILIGLFLFGCSMLYVQHSFITQYAGINFSLLSLNPFAFEENNTLQFRILAPVIGYLTFLRGEYFFILPLFFCFLLIVIVNFHYRSRRYSPIEAFIFTCIITFSCVILIPIYASGYTDIVTYFFIFLAFSKVQNQTISALFFSLALLNHECAAFILPGLILYSYSETKIQNNKLLRTILIYTIACIPHLCYRIYVNAHSQPLYTLEYYFSYSNVYIVLKNLLPQIIPAVFYSFKLFWIFPLLLFYHFLKVNKLQKVLVIISIIAGAGLQLIIAYDYTRLVVLAFPAILISAECIRELYPKKFASYGLVIILFNILITQYQYNLTGALKISVN